MIEIDLRFFNSLTRYRQGRDRITLPDSATIDDLLRRLQIPEPEIFLLLLNGRNIMRSLGGPIERHHRLQPGDRVALSGPVPFSRAYGSPVV